MRIKLYENEAKTLLANSDLLRYPIRMLNDSGQKLIRDWIFETAKEPECHNVDAYYEEAEYEANEFSDQKFQETVMHHSSTKSGMNESLILDKTHFDWILESCTNDDN